MYVYIIIIKPFFDFSFFFLHLMLIIRCTVQDDNDYYIKHIAGFIIDPSQRETYKARQAYLDRQLSG